jgi:ATP-dependent NAD(P)H-hydrate dehydratase
MAAGAGGGALWRARARALVPALDGTAHKGQHGRVGVVGGSPEYTGAPFYAAMAALRTGCDLAFVFCERSAAGPIKTYSPELMVFPTWDETPDDSGAGAAAAATRATLERSLARLDALVVGPGLGRSACSMAAARAALSVAGNANVPVLLDADALWLVSREPDIVTGNSLALLTPNVVELGRIWEAVAGEEGKKEEEARDDTATRVRDVVARLRGPVVLAKGKADLVVGRVGGEGGGEGVTVLGEQSDEVGSPRRCGGQGDVLSGVCGTFLAWATRKRGAVNARVLMDVALAASTVTRLAARRAFDEHGRSTVTPNLLEALGRAFEDFERSAP